MSIESIKEQLPEYAKDLKLNLGTLSRTTVLNDEQLWGTMIACAASTKNPEFYSQILEEAKQHINDESINAALGAAVIMGMNNVFYRTRGFLEGKYDDLSAGLRMNIIGNPGVPKLDFELWSLAVSAMNGCSHCVQAHENTLRKSEVSREIILEAIRIASVLAGSVVAFTIK